MEGNAMNDDTTDLDQTDEESVTSTLSDEVLGPAAGTVRASLEYPCSLNYPCNHTK